MKPRQAVLPLAALALAACQPGWVRLDGARPGADELQQAKTRCEVEQKLAQLEASYGDGSSQAGAINSNEARMLRLEDYDSTRRRVYREIEDCMRGQGLAPDA